MMGVRIKIHQLLLLINYNFKTTSLCINLNLDDVPINSRAHTDPSHSQTSLLLFTSLSLGTPFPDAT